jgi:hypothetical protein
MNELNGICQPVDHKVQLKIVVLIFLVIASSFSYLFIKAIYDPSIPFLRIDSRANWIMHRLSPELKARSGSFIHLTTEFSKDFELVAIPSRSLLYLRAFKQYDLWINDKKVQVNTTAQTNWKKTSIPEITKYLKEGTNTIKVKVTCDYGPPALWLYTEGLENNLKTDSSWTISVTGRSPLAASLANDCLVHPISKEGIKPYKAAIQKLPNLILFFVISFAIFWLHRYKHKNATLNRHPVMGLLTFNPRSVLIISIVAWIILYITNMPKIPLTLGFDAIGHLQYVQYLLDHHALPPAVEGWQAYNPPVFYLVSAIIFSLTRVFIHEGYAAYSLKLIPLFCGIGQICIVYFASGLCFPNSKTKQALSIAISAMIPMNIYICHYFSNESLCAFLMGLSLLVTIIILNRNRSSTGLFCILGLVIGFAMLTKVTAITILPVIFLVLLYKLKHEEKCHLNDLLYYLGLMFLLTVFVAGWFYFNNWKYFGKVFIGNWGPSLGFNWWQDPGFHTYKFFCQFGKVFSLPYFTGFYSFFDSIYSTFWGDSLIGGRALFAYRPPWNYEYMSVVYLLAVPATLAILIGTVRATINAVLCANKLWLLIIGSIFILFFSIAYMNLKIPFYAHAKAFYGLSTILPISLIFALGFDYVDKWLRRKKLTLLRAILYGWFGTLALTIFFTFLSRSV